VANAEFKATLARIRTEIDSKDRELDSITAALDTGRSLVRRAPATLVSQRVTREANILAYNDVFLVIAILAFLLFLWGVAIELKMRRRGDISPIIQFAQAMTAKLGAASQVKDPARE